MRLSLENSLIYENYGNILENFGFIKFGTFRDILTSLILKNYFTIFQNFLLELLNKY